MNKSVWSLMVRDPQSRYTNLSLHPDERECLLALRDNYDPEHEFEDVPEVVETWEHWTERFAEFFNLNVTVDQHYVQLAPDSLVVARFETRNYVFEGVGSDELMADLALKLAWKRHCEGYPAADPDLLEESWEDVQHLTYTIGKSYRDGSEI
jgi:hypothetical protein